MLAKMVSGALAFWPMQEGDVFTSRRLRPAAEAAPSAGPRLVAFLLSRHGAALVGDRRMAFTRLRETEAALSKAENRRDAVGGCDRVAYEFRAAYEFHVPRSCTPSATFPDRSTL